MQGSQTLVLNSKQLKSLSETFLADPGSVKHLDASNNQLKTGRSLERFGNIETLIIDENQLVSLYEFPVLLKLEHLSIIKNQIIDLDEFLRLSREKFPKLVHLNLMKNPVCPPFFLEEEQYHNYRQRVLAILPNLTVLDGFPVTPNDLKTFVAVIQNSNQKEADQSSGLGKQVVRQQYVEGDQARGMIEHNPKYARTAQNKNILKGTSQGNKHINNDKL